jgi:chromosome segregation ATPase
VIPLMAHSGIAAAVVAGFAGWQYGTSVEGAKLERARTAWAEERAGAADQHSKALRSEIEAHNRTRNELEADHANHEAERAVLRADAARAAAARDAADRAGRRLRDAAETNRLATRAALDAAGAAGLCTPALEAIDLRDRLLGRLEAAAQRVRSAAAGIGEHADAAFSAARECAGWADTVIKASAAP